MDKKISLNTIIVGSLQTNCYVLANQELKAAFIIDPGADAEKIKAVIEQNKLEIKGIILTHGHIDHIGAAEEFSSLPVYIHQLDAGFLKNSKKNLSVIFAEEKSLNLNLKIIEDKHQFSLGNIVIDVMHVPGHTPGSICLKVNGMLFSGDTLFQRGIGRTDIPGGSYQQLMNSLRKKILVLEDDILVYPGHGPQTTIGEEKMENPFI